MLLLPATTLALSMQTQAPPRVVVDLDVVADTLPLESEVYLSALQSLRPEGPWRDQKNLPEHRWRTFDLARKYHRVLRELRVVRPADACMMLRLLFEEDEVGRRAIAARQDPSGTKWEGGGWAPTQGELQGVRPGTRPLTAGEVVENWDEVLGPRCFARWRSESACRTKFTSRSGFSSPCLTLHARTWLRALLRATASPVRRNRSHRRRHPPALHGRRSGAGAGGRQGRPSLHRRLHGSGGGVHGRATHRQQPHSSSSSGPCHLLKSRHVDHAGARAAAVTAAAAPWAIAGAVPPLFTTAFSGAAAAAATVAWVLGNEPQALCHSIASLSRCCGRHPQRRLLPAPPFRL